MSFFKVSCFRGLILLVALGLGACTVETAQKSATQEPPQNAAKPLSAKDARAKSAGRKAARRFVNVISRMEPVAEAVCREKRGRNCDFKIVVDDRTNQPPNAFQTLDRRRRPILVFNLALIASVRNEDELAFVVGHEAAHHISSHLERRIERAKAAATVFAQAASAISGGDATAIRTGQEIGAVIGARAYSKEFELEADALGTIITERAGYDAIKGAQFFRKIPDPGNRFLGTHPPNSARLKTVRRVAQSVR